MNTKEAQAMVERAEREVEKERDRLNAAKNELEAALEKVVSGDAEGADFQRLLDARDRAQSKVAAHQLRLQNTEEVLARAREQHAKVDLEAKRVACRDAFIAVKQTSDKLDGIANRMRQQLAVEVAEFRAVYTIAHAAWSALPVEVRRAFPDLWVVSQWSNVHPAGTYGVDILREAAAASAAPYNIVNPENLK